MVGLSAFVSPDNAVTNPHSLCL